MDYEFKNIKKPKPEYTLYIEALEAEAEKEQGVHK